MRRAAFLSLGRKGSERMPYPTLHDFVAELILREQFEMLWCSFENECLGPHIRRVNPIADHNGRSEEIPAQALFPHFRAGIGRPADG